MTVGAFSADWAGDNRQTIEGIRRLSTEGDRLGEINLTLVANGREPINPWPAEDSRSAAPRWRRER